MITLFVLLVTSCFVVETLLSKPDWKQLGYHAVVPSLPGADAGVLAAGILGATVMSASWKGCGSRSELKGP